MTWNGLCPYCHGREFELTINSRDAVHVNCANAKCMTFIGTMEPDKIVHPPVAEEH